MGEQGCGCARAMEIGTYAMYSITQFGHVFSDGIPLTGTKFRDVARGLEFRCAKVAMGAQPRRN